MRVTIKGQVTIPRTVREKTGIVPGSEVEFRLDGNRVYLRKIAAEGRGESLVNRMTGKGCVKMTTDDILRLTRKG